MNKKLEQNNQIGDFASISDLGCAAALICVGFELVSTDKQNPRKVLFIFRKKVGTDEIINNYFLSRLKVDARNFFDTTKMLKTLIYNN